MAGDTRTLTLSLCADQEDLSVFTAEFVAANPMKLAWDNRAPIAHMATDDAQARNITLSSNGHPERHRIRTRLLPGKGVCTTGLRALQMTQPRASSTAAYRSALTTGAWTLVLTVCGVWGIAWLI